MRSTLALVAAVFALALVAAAPSNSLAAACDAPLGALPFVDGAGHGHRDPAQHVFGSSNLALVGHLNLPHGAAADLSLAPPVVDRARVLPDDLALVDAADHADGGATFGEVDVHGDLAVVAGISNPIGAWIVDVSDPAAPAIVGHWSGPASGYVTDVKWSTGGTAFYASVQAGSQVGVFLVDASNPASPVTSDFKAVTNGVHMMAVHDYAPAPGVDVVFGATGYSNGVFPFLATGDLPVKKLVPLPAITGVTAHDGWATVDPLTLRTLLYVANSYGGVRVLDVTAPAQPALVASWAGVSGAYMHTVRANVVDGKRTVFASPEYFFGSGAGPGVFYALDATDFSALRVVGTWRASDHAAGDLVFSTHNFQLVNGTVYLAHYHAGVWVLDARDPSAMVARAFYAPHDHTFTGTSAPWPVETFVPADWDVVVHEGRMFVGDITGGLYALHYACDATGPGGPSSVG